MTFPEERTRSVLEHIEHLVVVEEATGAKRASVAFDGGPPQLNHQVENGSLVAHSWPSPQRLTFLRMYDRRLRSLAKRLSHSSPSCVEQGA